jgi:L-asparaginase
MVTKITNMKKSLKKYVLTTILLCSVLQILPAENRPRITIIATGGTIAGISSSPTEASYDPARLSVEVLMEQVPALNDVAQIDGFQLCNVASQHMTTAIWIRLASVIDSLFSNGQCDGIVVTHGTDTMEETAFFLDLVLPHQNPVILTGAMRPSNGLGADGPANLFNAVCLAADSAAHGRGVMAVMNDYIFAAAEFTKTHTVNPQAFESPDHGPIGVIRGGKPVFFRSPRPVHTVHSRFSIRQLQQIVLPRVEVVLSYAGASSIPVEALIENGVEGIVVAGVGHGNYSLDIEKSIDRAVRCGVFVVRGSRVLRGGVTFGVESLSDSQIVSGFLSPQKARILLMLALTRYNTVEQVGELFGRYR